MEAALGWGVSHYHQSFEIDRQDATLVGTLSVNIIFFVIVVILRVAYLPPSWRYCDSPPSMTALLCVDCCPSCLLYLPLEHRFNLLQNRRPDVWSDEIYKCVSVELRLPSWSSLDETSWAQYCGRPLSWPLCMSPPQMGWQDTEEKGRGELVGWQLWLTFGLRRYFLQERL